MAEWASLVVDEIDETELLRGTLQGDTKERSLPVIIAKLPVDDMSKIMTPSWRWDGEYQLHGPRNVCGVIDHTNDGIFDSLQDHQSYRYL